MDYIQFKISEDEIICECVFSNFKKNFFGRDAFMLYNLLRNSDYISSNIHLYKSSIIKYYGVREEILKELYRNRKNTKRKVKRINKYRAGVCTLGTLLAVTTSIGSVNQLLKKKTEEEIVNFTYNVGNSKLVNNDINNVKKVANSDVISSIENTNYVYRIADDTFDFEYSDRSMNKKIQFVKSNYKDVINKYSKMYGLPSSLVMAAAAQESGQHCETISPGGGFGLMQIQIEGSWNWSGKPLTAYNYELGDYETINVCIDKNGNYNEDMLADLDYNVKVGCMIMASNLEQYNYDFIAALQAYNSGNEVLNLMEQYGEEWIYYRNFLPGDPEYIEHVLSYISIDDNFLEYKSPDGKNHSIQVFNTTNYNIKAR